MPDKIDTRKQMKRIEIARALVEIALERAEAIGVAVVFRAGPKTIHIQKQSLAYRHPDEN